MRANILTMTEARFKQLLDRWLHAHLTPEELDEFLASLQFPVAEKVLGASIITDLQKAHLSMAREDRKDSEVVEKILQKLDLHSGTIKSRKPYILPVKYWLAAASVLAAVLLAGYFIGSRESSPLAESHTDSLDTILNVTAPIRSFAVLTMPDGSTIDVNGLKDSIALPQYGVLLKRFSNGEIQYLPLNGNAMEPVMARADNPKRSQPLSLRLADGSTVLLNAASSISYPVVFAGTERKVTVTGEAYFEVAKDPRRKFIVSTGYATTEVLGTHFNVRAYEDEQYAKVTLLEGAVNVLNNKTGTVNRLKPNQQARLNAASDLIKDIDPDEVMAWKSDILSFNSSDVMTIMNELSHWYGVNIRYTGKIPDKSFSGRISRSTDLANVLEVLKQSGINIQFKDQTIIVSP